MIPVLIADIQQRKDDELQILKKCKFLGFIKITDDIILPTFDYKSNKLIVTPPEYQMQVCRFVDERNKPGSSASNVNCLIYYLYLVKHWR